jgi:hypothetical protein
VVVKGIARFCPTVAEPFAFDSRKPGRQGDSDSPCRELSG